MYTRQISPNCERKRSEQVAFIVLMAQTVAGYFCYNSLAVAQSNSEFFAPIEAGRDVDDRRLDGIIKDFVLASSRQGKLPYFQMYLRTTPAFDGMKKVASSKKLGPELSSSARSALGRVSDERAAVRLVEIANDESLPEKFRTEAHEGLQKHAVRGSLAAIEYMALTKSDSKIPQFLRDATSQFMTRDDLPTSTRSSIEKGLSAIAARRVASVANLRLRKQLFSMIDGHYDWSDENLDVIVKEFVIEHTRPTNLPRFFSRYLRTDAAFDAIKVVACSTELESEISKAARLALFEIRDKRSVKPLCDIALDTHLPDVFRLDAHDGLLGKIYQGSEPAAKYLDRVINSDSMCSSMNTSTASFIDNIGPGMNLNALRLLSTSTNELIAKPANDELDRLKTVDNRLTIDDTWALESFKRDHINTIEAYVKVNDQKAIELRKQKSSAATKATIRALTIQNKQIQKFLGEYKKRPIFELAVDELAEYCKESQEGARFTELTAAELNQDAAAKRALADSLPIIRTTTTVVDAAGYVKPDTQEVTEFDAGLMVGIANMFAWDARLNAKAAKERADAIQRRLNQLSDEGLRQIKIAYLNRLDNAAKQTKR